MTSAAAAPGPTPGTTVRVNAHTAVMYDADCASEPGRNLLNEPFAADGGFDGPAVDG